MRRQVRETDAGRPAGTAVVDAKVKHLHDAVIQKLKMAEAGRRGAGMRSARGGEGT
jgi:hypothetical protein